jgi:EmrB/QacA subfamily drug resistance transporter
MNLMDSTIVNVALPTLGRQFHVAAVDIEAVVVGYLVSVAIFIPVSGWLGDRWGTKTVFLLSLAIFTGASALCGTAQSLGELTAYRVLQGIGGGMMTPIGTAMLFRVFKPYERIRASRILTIPTILAPASGPVLGGLLVDSLSWRWVFYVNVPIGVLALLFGLLFLRDDREQSAGRIDIPGFVFSAFGFALMMFALSEAPMLGWTSPLVLSTLAIGLIGVVALIVTELRVRHPMLHLHLLSERLYRSASSVIMFQSAAFMGMLFVIPLLIQDGHHLSALVSGSIVFPEAIGVMVGSQVVSRVYPRVGPRRLLIGGQIGVAFFMAVLAVFSGGDGFWLLRGILFFAGFSNSFVFQTAQTLAFAVASQTTTTSRISALYNTQRQMGAALGVGVLSSIIALVGPTRLLAGGALVANLPSYQWAFALAAALTSVGAVIALTVHDRDAISTMRPPELDEKELSEAGVQTMPEAAAS